uniref:Uncharacterized protein n=1 Tax=Mucochytrium quahogii TaxID=96639 RepID=A0A7S2S4N5_9STRA|mmetsp:Transcript_20767/g.34331  ORF Transcript_20767/g.34331 Transcript_20767/m.34331 type:complete len:114 (+) Transcript_20767:156-497(+)|eukprot:CAMPEP_0203745144 /NCGR_PEP_ID=MMETSP0098-20131031/981_1 /ASSEMBLY_ACC=CAM_ASM_000208 /TAXON_ID=96639 /ORGANISM=" , Strain NY0313808BC1" /LENGTH=113 /DNA_ID=CAMNT_0050632845 /DNA_START=174 /DNA_END=515 /DNA_ORIENTATION=+
MFATNVLRQAARIKPTTGIVGLPVVPNAREVLTELYTKTLDNIKEYPKENTYRTSVEQITNFRLKVVKENEDIDTIEETIDCGQVEELIEQAEEELDLMEALKGSGIGEPRAY